MTAFLESWGTGVSRIVEACKAVGLPEPEYGTDGAFVWITFKRPSSVTNSDTLTQHTEEGGQKTTQKTTQKLTKMQNDILDFLRTNPTASRKEVKENIANSTEDGIKYNLERLKKLGLLRRVGPNKGGFWEIIE